MIDEEVFHPGDAGQWKKRIKEIVEPWRYRVLRVVDNPFSLREQDGNDENRDAMELIAYRYRTFPMHRLCKQCSLDCKQTTAPRLEFICADFSPAEK